jgi:hypothetical protein
MKKVLMGLMSLFVVCSLTACANLGVGGEKVESEALERVSYNAESQDLMLVFERGTYRFSDVPQDVYDGLMSAESKGAFFQQNIKAKYEAEKVK